jgi:NADH-ubiquinone oxidoreductase chain 5
MEGPTPVSALIHAATMVTAGVYLLIRLSFILEYTYSIRILIVIIGMTTAIFASVIGSFQNDLKSIIAYSTCSQLGYMVSICGLSGYSIAFFHLINHGFFKALLFLSSGVIIHNFLDEQDIRKMGGLFYIFPLTYVFIFISSLSLFGFPFFSGFFTKDILLEYLYISPFSIGNLGYHMGITAALFTIYYSFRLLFYVFITKPNGFNLNYSSSFENYSIFMLVGMTFLGLLSIFSGFLLKNFFYSGSIFFYDSISIFSYLFIRQTINIEFFFLNSSNI